MTPYYQDALVTLYHGDCGQVLCNDFPIASFDLLLTDPPYGIKADKGQAQRANRQDGRALAPSSDYGPAAMWDQKPAPKWLILMIMSLCKWQVIFGGNYFELPPARCWLVWDKDNGSNDYADCELAWTNLEKPVRKITHRWHGMLQEPGYPKENREHPTQKPESVMRWALGQAPESVQTVFDPFAGSGTTLVAAKRLGKKAVGIEREERYCEGAARRLSQGTLSEMFQ